MHRLMHGCGLHSPAPIGADVGWPVSRRRRWKDGWLACPHLDQIRAGVAGEGGRSEGDCLVAPPLSGMGGRLGVGLAMCRDLGLVSWLAPPLNGVGG